MYYELYIDLFFAENFMMDSLLLLFVARISKRQVKRNEDFCWGAAAGSLLTCLVIALPIPSAALKMILFHGFRKCFLC